MQISWQLIIFYVTCNPNNYSRFWWVPVNILERFLKKITLRSSQNLFLVSLILNLGACRPRVPSKDAKNREIKEQFVLKSKKTSLKIILKNLNRFFKKLLQDLVKNLLQYLYTKFRSWGFFVERVRKQICRWTQ